MINHSGNNTSAALEMIPAVLSTRFCASSHRLSSISARMAGNCEVEESAQREGPKTVCLNCVRSGI